MEYFEADCKELQDFDHEIMAIFLKLADVGLMIYESWCEWLLCLSIHKFAEI